MTMVLRSTPLNSNFTKHLTREWNSFSLRNVNATCCNYSHRGVKLLNATSKVLCLKKHNNAISETHYPKCDNRSFRIHSLYRYGREGWIEDIGTSEYSFDENDDEEEEDGDDDEFNYHFQRQSRVKQNEDLKQTTVDSQTFQNHSHRSQNYAENFFEEEEREDEDEGDRIPLKEKRDSNNSEKIWSLVFGNGGLLFLLENFFKWLQKASMLSNKFIKNSLPSSFPSEISDGIINICFLMIAIWIIKSLLDAMCAFALVITSLVLILWVSSYAHSYFKNYANFDRRPKIHNSDSHNSARDFHSFKKKKKNDSNNNGKSSYKRNDGYYHDEDNNNRNNYNTNGSVSKKENKSIFFILNETFDNALKSFLNDDSFFSAKNKRKKYPFQFNQTENELDSFDQIKKKNLRQKKRFDSFDQGLENDFDLNSENLNNNLNHNLNLDSNLNLNLNDVDRGLNDSKNFGQKSKKFYSYGQKSTKFETLGRKSSKFVSLGWGNETNLDEFVWGD